MMAADSLRFIVPFGVPSCRPSPCRRAYRASASASHVAQHPAPLSHVQASCLERALPGAVSAFAGALAARAVTPPCRRCPERQRGAKAEGKTKGFGTLPTAKPVCTWGERGTEQLRRRAAFGARVAPMQAHPRASHARTRGSLRGAQP
ncbi:hypothetical protein BZL42_08875 [Pseudomonas indica]|nr:hypothetical protein BZL42_08875 [Pseudomonas indica]